MDGVLTFFLSVNKISLLAFLGVLGFLVYEVSLLRKEQLKKQKPSIPQFNTAAVIDKKVIEHQAASVVKEKTVVATKQSKSSPAIILVLIVAILTFAGLSVYLFMNRMSDETEKNEEPKIIVNEVSSSGLKVFDPQWNEITEAEAPKLLSNGGLVYIGIETINEADIDRARIKVNKKNWNIQDITEKFNSDKKMYYIEYKVASEASQLQIDAQLHSSVDGWLGD